MSYRIGSFNMYKFQAYRSDDEIRKDVGKIAEIISREKFDIVGLQEIHSKEALNMLLRHLGHWWEGRWEKPHYASSGAAEGYAFIWNTMRFRLASTIIDDNSVRIAEPHIFYQYKLDPAKWQEKLVRDPYYARFEPVSGSFGEVRLINAHIMFSRSNNHSEDNPLGDLKMRRNEHKILSEVLYPKIADRVYGNNRPGYTILLGDYNLNLPSSGATGAFLQETFTIQDGRVTKNITTVQSDFSTLKKVCDSENESTSNIWANNYDHFTYDVNRFEGIGMSAARVDSTKYCSNYIEHRRTISDHVPVKLDINLRND